MDGLTCDACGATLLLDSDVRYVLEIAGYAAWDPLELTAADLAQDHAAALASVLASMEALDADEAQDQVHRSWRFDLCPPCWRRWLTDPLSAARPPPRSGKNEKSQGD